MSKIFYLKNTAKYRVYGEDLYPNDSSVFRTTSAIMTIEKNTDITVDKIGINEYHPDMFRAFIPSMDAFIEAISFTDVSNTPALNEGGVVGEP